MKRLLIYAGLILTLGFVFTSCYKDIIVPVLASDPDGPPQPVSYKRSEEHTSELQSR